LRRGLECCRGGFWGRYMKIRERRWRGWRDETGQEGQRRNEGDWLRLMNGNFPSSKSFPSPKMRHVQT
jgi:hypothetical protein